MWIEPVRDWNKFAPTKKISLFNSVNWTCEGLKRWKLYGNYNLNMVWIEPVRDWNDQTSTVPSLNSICVNWTCEGLKPKTSQPLILLPTKCELNLWGIETQGWYFGYSKVSKCELNLWGIETSLMRNLKLLDDGVNWTCEGLKQL